MPKNDAFSVTNEQHSRSKKEFFVTGSNDLNIPDLLKLQVIFAKLAKQAEEFISLF